MQLLSHLTDIGVVTEEKFKGKGYRKLRNDVALSIIVSLNFSSISIVEEVPRDLLYFSS